MGLTRCKHCDQVLRNCVCHHIDWQSRAEIAEARIAELEGCALSEFAQKCGSNAELKCKIKELQNTIEILQQEARSNNNKIKAWCVFGPTDVWMVWVIRETRSKAIKAVQKNLRVSWGVLKKQGYTCRKVEIREVSNDE